MKRFRVCILLTCLLGIAAMPGRAETIVDNLGQPTQNYAGPIGDDSNTNDFLLAQEFMLPAGAVPYQLNQITLLLTATGGGANITVSVWNAGPDNNPTNEIAVVSTQRVTTAGNAVFTPSTTIVLEPGIYYVVAAPATYADSGHVSWAFASTTNWNGPGILSDFADTYYGSWQNYSITNLPQQLSVQASPVPAALGISRRGGATTISWASALNGYVVESATNLASPSWQAITNAPKPVASNNTLTNNWSGPTRFFRLRQSFAVENLDQPNTGWDGPIGNDSTTNDFLIGQEFMLPAGKYALNQVTLLLTPVQNSSGNVTVSIWNAGPENDPSNQVALVSSQPVTHFGNVVFVPSSSITLSGGNYYVVAAPTTSADNAKIGWEWTDSLVWTGFGTLGSIASTYPGVWANAPINFGPYQMSIQATPTH